MIKGVIIKPGCIACGTCQRICPSIFKVTDQSQVISNDYDENESQVFEAEKNCPVSVISVESDAANVANALLEVKFGGLKNIASLIWNVFVKVDSTDFKYTPGQYVSFYMNDANGDFIRSYSIVSYRDNVLEFCIKFIPESRGFGWFKTLADGQMVKITSPKGVFTLQENSNPKLFIVTGTGLAPIVAMLENMPEGVSAVQKNLVVGVSSDSEICYQDRLSAIPNLNVIFVASKPTENWKGPVGRVGDCLQNVSFDSQTEVYLCGNPYMVDDMSKYFHESGHASERIFMEHFASAKSTVNAGILDALIFKGKIPYLAIISNIIYGIAFLSPIIVMISPRTYRDFGNVGWNILFGVMLVRPLADIFPDIGFLRTLMSLRREFGVMCTIFIINHMLGYFPATGNQLSSIFSDSTYWNPSNLFLWGIVGLALGLPPLLTSNNFAMRILKKNWKHVQQLAYLFFIFGAMHLVFIEGVGAIFYVLGVAFFWALAAAKIQFKIPEKIKEKIVGLF